MRDLNDKVTGGNLTADQWNDVPTEMQNIIEDMGQTLSAGDLDQMGKAISGMCGAASWYSETGIVNAYVATVVGAKQGPQNLGAVHDGLIVRFRPGNTNTAASTVNINGLGVKDIVRENGAALSGGELSTLRDTYLRWDQGADDFRVLNFALDALDTFSGFKVNRSTDGAVGNLSSLEIVWENEVFDEGGWFDDAPEDDKITIPAGVTRVLFMANVELDEVLESILVECEFFKNGATANGMGRLIGRHGDGVNPDGLTAILQLSMIDSCVAGDEYSFNVVNNQPLAPSVGVIGTGNHCWFTGVALKRSA